MGETYYWCLHCERAFAAKMQPESCGYRDCDGSVVDLREWSEFQNEHRDYEGYPKEPQKGVRYPLFPE